MSKKRAERSLAGAALLFAALGDPTRLLLLRRLSDGGPASISALAGTFPAMTRQGVTKHLQVLAAAGVINGSRHGREHVWTVDPARLAEGRRQLELIARGWDDALARLKRHVESRLRLD
jgi:DNA-binding transcriptional ArsR family regulator